MRVTRPDAIPDAAERLDAFLEAGRHGDMGWMEARTEQRGDPLKLWPEARSVIMLGLNYGPRRDPRAVLGEPRIGAHGTLVFFVHPKDMGGVLTEIMESPKGEH